MTEPSTAPAARTVWIAGSTGLVGSALLSRLLARPGDAPVHALVRRLPDHPVAHPALHWHPVDFANLPALPPADDVVIALGTTIAVAGSRENFRRVDFDAVVDTARAARQAGATRVAVVSALGADPRSSVFYNRIKGEMEQAVGALGFTTTVFARPSLLLGDRDRLDQPGRPAERWAQRLAGPLSALVPRRIRPVSAEAVADVLLARLGQGQVGVQVVESLEIGRSTTR